MSQTVPLRSFVGLEGGVALPPSPERIQAKFELAIALTLFTWPSLTLAVQNSWGGPESSEKRDWFAGAVSGLITNTPDADVEYVEEFLLQIMNDEFDVNVDDDSGEEIAAKIVGLRKMTLQGDFDMVDQMYRQWQLRHDNTDTGKIFKYMDQDDDDDDDDDTVDGESDDTDDGERNGDLEMDEAPALVKLPKPKVQPKVDEDGFTEVVSKKKR